MSGENTESKLSVDVGLSARAEISAEIPAASSGRLVDALTDLIRPFTEKQGLKADRIRLQREDVLIKIAQKARKRVAVETTRQPLPPKFMVPFLEKASTEDPGSELIDWWASLLVAAFSDHQNSRPIFVDIISRLTDVEARLLERLWAQNGRKGEALDTADWLERFGESYRNRSEAIPKFLDGEIFNASIERVVQDTINDLKAHGAHTTYVRFPGGRGPKTIVDRRETRTFEVCTVLGITKRVVFELPIATPYIGEFACGVELFCLSELGCQLMVACHVPDAG